MKKQTASMAIVWDERYLRHDTGPYHPERPQRLEAIKEVLDTDSTLLKLNPRLATEEEVQWVHAAAHVAAVKKTSGEEGHFDGDTPYSAESSTAAFLAAGGALAAADAVMKGEALSAFAFPRPPGHHAEADRAMGFCLFNNVAVAAEYLLRKHGLKRVAIVDIDVHHGNGTQHVFYNRPDIFYISSHRFPFYPGTGAAHEKGIGAGLGYNLNLPLPALTGDDVYQKIYEESVYKALKDFKPEFLIVSAGFDAHKLDPLGGMNLSQGGFEKITAVLKKVAKEECRGRVLWVLEGGYDLIGLKEGVSAVLTPL